MYDLRQVTIYTAGDSAQASLLVNRLERHGIRAMVLNETLQSGAAEIIGQAVALKIVVVASEADAARGVRLSNDVASPRLKGVARPAYQLLLLLCRQVVQHVEQLERDPTVSFPKFD